MQSVLPTYCLQKAYDFISALCEYGLEDSRHPDWGDFDHYVFIPKTPIINPWRVNTSPRALVNGWHEVEREFEVYADDKFVARLELSGRIYTEGGDVETAWWAIKSVAYATDLTLGSPWVETAFEVVTHVLPALTAPVLPRLTPAA